MKAETLCILANHFDLRIDTKFFTLTGLVRVVCDGWTLTNDQCDARAAWHLFYSEYRKAGGA